MVRPDDIRAGEVAVDTPAAQGAGLVFIGTIHTPWVAALDGIAACERVEVLYWLDRSRRDLVWQSPANDDAPRGTFALRSPVRDRAGGAFVADQRNVVLVGGTGTGRSHRAAWAIAG